MHDETTSCNDAQSRRFPLSGRAHSIEATRNRFSCGECVREYMVTPGSNPGLPFWSCHRMRQSRRHIGACREQAQRSEPRERSEPAKRRASESVGESEGRSPSDNRRCARPRSGGPAAQHRVYLALLPSGPDAVRRLNLHRVRTAVRRMLSPSVYHDSTRRNRRGRALSRSP